MPETITIAGKKLPKPLIIAGGAAVVGIVGYAYISRNRITSTGEEDTALVDDMGDERITPTTLDTFDVKVDNRAGFKTDQEWHDAAIELLTNNYGVGSVSIAAKALDKYLRNLSMTNTEADMLHYVINTIGPPPSGSKSIKVDTSTAPTSSQTNRAAPMVSVTTVPGKATFKWSRPTGVISSQVAREISGKVSAFTDIGSKSSYDWTGLKRGGGYRLHVRFKYSDGTYSPHGTAYTTGK